MKLTIFDPTILRTLSGNSLIISEENRIAAANGHLFKPGDTAILTGLQSFPEYNGEPVEITNIREDAEGKRAYYVKGRINSVMNWVYEYRLKPVVIATPTTTTPTGGAQ